MVKQVSKIPLVRATNGEVLPGNPFSSVVLSSACTNWQNLVVEEHHFPIHELDGLMYIQHVIAVNLGRPIACEFKEDGRFQRISKAKSTIYLSTSHRPFHVCRRPQKDENGSADALYVALDPVFVSQAAEALEIYPDHIELVEQQRETDSTLLHIAMALRASVQARRTGGFADQSHLTRHLKDFFGVTPKMFLEGRL